MAAPSGTTPIAALPYPIPDDDVDVPRDILALATKLDPRIPTTNENDALVGTSGAPSSGNRYVTDLDPRMSSVSNQLSKIVGDGSIGPYTFDHNLGTNDVAIEVYETTAPNATVECATERTTINRVTIRPDVAVPVNGAVILVTSKGGTGGAVAAHGSSHLPGVGSDPLEIPLIIPPATLPAGVDKQEVYYLADATNGVIWRFRYRAASPSPYKWELVSGTPLYSFIPVTESISPAGTWMNLPTVGPDVVVPLAGDYDADWGVTHSVLNGQVQVGLAIGNATPGDPVIYAYNASTASAIYETGASKMKWPGMAVGNIIRTRYIGAVGGSVARNRWLSVTPRRVA